MLSSFLKKNLYSVIFVAVELIFFIFIIFVAPQKVNILQWVSILCCLLFAGIMIRKVNLLVAALLFTVAADGYLVLAQPAMQSPGMSFFALVSICYFLFLFLKETGNLRKIHLFSRIFLVVLGLIITPIVLREKTDYLSMISVFYFANLLANIVFSFITFKENKLLSIGLVLFALCDIVVGLTSAANVYFPIKQGGFVEFLINSRINFAWLFYLPAQVILTLFAVNYFNKSKQKPQE